MPGRRSEETLFVADAMLGSLARKLRAFGYDTQYFKQGDDTLLIISARLEGRILLSSDGALVSRAKARKVRAMLIVGKTEGKRIGSLARNAKAERVRLVGGDSRCSLCNGRLHKLPKREAAGKAPQSVVSRHRLFHECEDCGQVYWRGAHWKKLRWLKRVLRTKPYGHAPGRREEGSRISPAKP